jgi:hypothetical protein
MGGTLKTQTELEKFQQKLIKELEGSINDLWDLSDEARSAGNSGLADDYAAQAFQLLERLPQNEIYVKTKQ